MATERPPLLPPTTPPSPRPSGGCAAWGGPRPASCWRCLCFAGTAVLLVKLFPSDALVSPVLGPGRRRWEEGVSPVPSGWDIPTGKLSWLWGGVPCPPACRAPSCRHSSAQTEPRLHLCPIRHQPLVWVDNLLASLPALASDVPWPLGAPQRGNSSFWRLRMVGKEGSVGDSLQSSFHPSSQSSSHLFICPSTRLSTCHRLTPPMGQAFS